MVTARVVAVGPHRAAEPEAVLVLIHAARRLAARVEETYEDERRDPRGARVDARSDGERATTHILIVRGAACPHTRSLAQRAPSR